MQKSRKSRIVFFHKFKLLFVSFEQFSSLDDLVSAHNSVSLYMLVGAVFSALCFTVLCVATVVLF